MERIGCAGAELARRAELSELLIGKVGRYVPEIESAHGVILVRDVADPGVQRPAASLDAGLGVEKRIRVRLVRIERRYVEIECIAARHVEPQECAAAIAQGRRYGRLPPRSIRQRAIRQSDPVQREAVI